MALPTAEELKKIRAEKMAEKMALADEEMKRFMASIEPKFVKSMTEYGSFSREFNCTEDHLAVRFAQDLEQKGYDVTYKRSTGGLTDRHMPGQLKVKFKSE